MSLRQRHQLSPCEAPSFDEAKRQTDGRTDGRTDRDTKTHFQPVLRTCRCSTVSCVARATSSLSRPGLGTLNHSIAAGESHLRPKPEESRSPSIQELNILPLSERNSTYAQTQARLRPLLGENQCQNELNEQHEVSTATPVLAWPAFSLSR